MTVPAQLGDLLGRSMDGVARIVVRHERSTAFRWLGLVELSLACCALPCVIALVLLLDDGGDGHAGGNERGLLERMWDRLHTHHHDITVLFLGPDGAPLAEVRHRPANETEGDAMIGSVLVAAVSQGMVVVETIAPAEMLEAWYGGRPLLSRPEAIDLSATRHRLEAAGIDVRTERERVDLELPEPEPSRLGAIVLLLLVLPLVPVLLLFGRARQQLGEMWLTARGAPAPVTRLVVRAESLELSTRRGERVVDEARFDIVELLGVSWAPALGYGREVARIRPRLRLVCRQSSRTVPVDIRDAGDALRSFLVGAILQLRLHRPDLPGLTADATHCPYCSTLYRIEPGAKCPRCGAWAGALS